MRASKCSIAPPRSPLARTAAAGRRAAPAARAAGGFDALPARRLALGPLGRRRRGRDRAPLLPAGRAAPGRRPRRGERRRPAGRASAGARTGRARGRRRRSARAPGAPRRARRAAVGRGGALRRSAPLQRSTSARGATRRGEKRRSPAVCPFLGLATFDAAHAEYFFGRERLVAELVARLVGSPLLAVVGPSGSGKSSAVRAGLLPALAGGVLPGSERWRQALMRPGPHPLGAARARAPGARRACGARGRPVRGGVHGLPRRGRADRVPGCARRARGRPRPERPGGGRHARRLLRPLRGARAARAAGGREPGAGRPDAARRAAPCDRGAGATGRPAGGAVADGRADRRRARSAGRACRCCPPLCSSSGASARGG